MEWVPSGHTYFSLHLELKISYIYIYIFIHTYMYIYTYVSNFNLSSAYYRYTNRQTDRQTDRQTIHTLWYMYVYTCSPHNSNLVSTNFLFIPNFLGSLHRNKTKCSEGKDRLIKKKIELPKQTILCTHY